MLKNVTSSSSRKEDMMKVNTEDNKYQKAEKRVEETRGFHARPVSYVMVNSFLFLINITISGR